jgi:ribosomal protein S18 acetylase RimI-like enzyme
MHVCVAEADGAVVAFMAVSLDPERSVGELCMIAVDPETQNRGLGTRLTNMATDWIREAGMKIAKIGTGGDPGHAPARRAYDKAGRSRRWCSSSSSRLHTDADRELLQGPLSCPVQGRS